ncbi:MAG: dockerin type I domain-containing protein [Ruminococcus sp.]
MKKNSFKFKIFSVILVLCLFNSLVGITVSAADVSYFLTTAEIDPYTYESGADNFPSELCNYVKQKFTEYTKYVDVSKYNISTDDAASLLTSVLLENPEVFYVSPMSFSYGLGSNGYVSVIAPHYLYDKSEIPSEIQKFENTAKKLISGIGKDWEQKVIALTVHDNMILNCQYAKDEVQQDDVNPEIYTAYGCLVNQKAVCQGYALAYNYLLSQFGIEASMVTSVEMDHGWSLVKIDGEYYHVDTTWDDPTYDRLGQAQHKYFLKSDENLALTHSSWSAECSASSQTYDTYFWNDVTTQIPYIDGKFYYINNVPSAGNLGDLVSYDGNTESVIAHIDDRWSSNKATKAYWLNNFSALAVKDNVLYYNTPDKIYSINPDGTDKKMIYQLSEEELQTGNIYGFVINDNGDFYCSLSYSPNIAQTNQVVNDSTQNTVYLAGDVTGDGKISIQDATTIQLYVAYLTSLTDAQIKVADINSDGNINIFDATEIQLMLAELN